MRLLATPVRQRQAFRAPLLSNFAIDIYPHRNQNVSGVRAVGTHGSAHLDEWRRAFAAAAQPDAQPSALLLSCKTSGARNRVATDHRKRQPPQASRGPQRATERVAPQEAKARTHAGSPKAESYQGRSAATRQARTHDDAVVPRQGCQSAGGPAGPAAQGTTGEALSATTRTARRTATNVRLLEAVPQAPCDARRSRLRPLERARPASRTRAAMACCGTVP